MRESVTRAPLSGIKKLNFRGLVPLRALPSCRNAGPSSRRSVRVVRERRASKAFGHRAVSNDESLQKKAALLRMILRGHKKWREERALNLGLTAAATGEVPCHSPPKMYGPPTAPSEQRSHFDSIILLRRRSFEGQADSGE